ncbi:hypothetical protein FF021_02015 [Leptospira noguchii]|nr:hypothetical protein FF021_02015 [Leptospira noguchii]
MNFFIHLDFLTSNSRITSDYNQHHLPRNSVIGKLVCRFTEKQKNDIKKQSNVYQFRRETNRKIRFLV